MSLRTRYSYDENRKIRVWVDRGDSRCCDTNCEQFIRAWVPGESFCARYNDRKRHAENGGAFFRDARCIKDFGG